jgi:hypothetical protein
MTALGIEMLQRGYKVKFITALCTRVGDFWLKCKYPGIAYIAEMPVVVATSSLPCRKLPLRITYPKSPVR